MQCCIYNMKPACAIQDALWGQGAVLNGEILL